jgi:LacI family transcriptional regulator
MLRSKVTLKMIAELSGVSRGTVHRVINNKGKVKASVARKVQEIAQSLNYQPNLVARSLATQQFDFKICVILHIQGNLFFNALLEGVKNAADEIADFGVSVAIKPGLNLDVEQQLGNISAAVEEGFRAIILIPINDPRIVARVSELAGKGIAVILLNNNLEHCDCLGYVGCDHWKSGKLAAGLLRIATGGQSRIGVVSPPLAMLGFKQRLQGLRSALEADHPGMELVAVQEVPSDDELSYSLTRAMFLQHPKIDSLLYATSGLVGGLQALKDLGLYGTIRTIAVDQTAPIVDAILDGGVLATICHEPEQQGYAAVKMASGFLISKTVPEKKNWLVDPTIRIRESFQ